MSDPHREITIQHDPDNRAAVALVDGIYSMLMPQCVAIRTRWVDDIEEHRFTLRED